VPICLKNIGARDAFAAAFSGFCIRFSALHSLLPFPVGRRFPLRCIRFSCNIVSWLLRSFAGCRVLVSLLRRLFAAPARFAYPSSLCRILVFPLFGSREAFLFFGCPLCSVHVYPLFLRLSHFHFLNPIFPRSDRYIPAPPQGHAAGSAVVGELATVGEEKYAGEDEGRCKAGVENRNESLGQPPEAPDRNTERNH